MKIAGEQLYIAGSLVFWAILFIGINSLYDLLRNKWAGLPQKERIMKKLVLYLRAINGIIAIALELVLYAVAVMGKITIFQLVAGFCLLRIAEYCYSLGYKRAQAQAQAVPKHSQPRYAASVVVDVTTRDNINYARSACFEAYSGDSIMDVLAHAAQNTSVFDARPEQCNITISIKNINWEYRGMGPH